MQSAQGRKLKMPDEALDDGPCGTAISAVCYYVSTSVVVVAAATMSGSGTDVTLVQKLTAVPKRLSQS